MAMSRAFITSLLLAAAFVVVSAGDDGDVLVLDADNFDREVTYHLCVNTGERFLDRVLTCRLNDTPLEIKPFWLNSTPRGVDTASLWSQSTRR
jgi:hypothetical protein